MREDSAGDGLLQEVINFDFGDRCCFLKAVRLLLKVSSYSFLHGENDDN